MSEPESALFARATSVIPGGVNSPVRAFGAVGGEPRFIASARGPWLEDTDGQRLLDLVGGWGPALLGHAHPVVVAAVQDAAANGLGFGAATEREVELAETVRDRLTVDGRSAAEYVRLVSTGTEATMSAVRLARGATGRDVIVKFAGHYHGHSDALLANAGSGLATLSLPASAGVPASATADTRVLPYNDLGAVEALFAAEGDRIAAVIVEAAAANMGVVAPDAGFNRSLADVVHRHGALLILDEVLTGFRVGPAGWWGTEASEYLPDLVTLGKVIGGGLPVAAVAGRAEIMQLLAPLGPVYQAGTLSGNPVAVAAGLTTLALADDGVYRDIDRTATQVAGMVSEALAAEGVAHSVQQAGSLFSFAFGDESLLGTDGPRDWAAVQRQQAWRYPPFFHALLDAGVYPPPSVFEAWFVSATHDAEALDVLDAALPAAARAAAAARPHHVT